MQKTRLVLLAIGAFVLLPAGSPAHARSFATNLGTNSTVQKLANGAQRIERIVRKTYGLWPHGSRRITEKLTRADRGWYKSNGKVELGKWSVLDKQGRVLWSDRVVGEDGSTVDAGAANERDPSRAVADRAVLYALRHPDKAATLRFDHTHPPRSWVRRLLLPNRGFSSPDRFLAHNIRAFMAEKGVGKLSLEMGVLTRDWRNRELKKHVQEIPRP